MLIGIVFTALHIGHKFLCIDCFRSFSFPAAPAVPKITQHTDTSFNQSPEPTASHLYHSDHSADGLCLHRPYYFVSASPSIPREQRVLEIHYWASIPCTDSELRCDEEHWECRNLVRTRHESSGGWNRTEDVARTDHRRVQAAAKGRQQRHSRSIRRFQDFVLHWHNWYNLLKDRKYV